MDHRSEFGAHRIHEDGMVIDCSDYDGYMNKLDYIKRGWAHNNFRTPQANIYANNGIYILDFYR